MANKIIQSQFFVWRLIYLPRDRLCAPFFQLYHWYIICYLGNTTVQERCKQRLHTLPTSGVVQCKNDPSPQGRWLWQLNQSMQEAPLVGRPKSSSLCPAVCNRPFVFLMQQSASVSTASSREQTDILNCRTKNPTIHFDPVKTATKHIIIVFKMTFG